jgi:hypothetical protein
VPFAMAFLIDGRAARKGVDQIVLNIEGGLQKDEVEINVTLPRSGSPIAAGDANLQSAK